MEATFFLILCLYNYGQEYRSIPLCFFQFSLLIPTHKHTCTGILPPGHTDTSRSHLQY